MSRFALLSFLLFLSAFAMASSDRIVQSKYVRHGKYFRLYAVRGASSVVYSDDSGASWQALGTSDVLPSELRSEVRVGELPDGSILLAARDTCSGCRLRVFTYDNSAKTTGKWGEEAMPPNMSIEWVDASKGKLVVVPAVRIKDNTPLFMALQTFSQGAGSDSLVSFYKELATYTDYAVPEKLAKGWKRGFCLALSDDRGNEDLDVLRITNGVYANADMVDPSQYLIDCALAQRTELVLPVRKVDYDASVHEIDLWRGEGRSIEIPFDSLTHGTLKLLVAGDKKILPYVSAHFLRGVVTDDFRGCGNPPASLQAWTVPDVIGEDTIQSTHGDVYNAFWLRILPNNKLKAGEYKVKITLTENGAFKQAFDVIVKVSKRELKWADTFHLNFWMQPYAVSRYYGLKPWSKQHFEAMRPYMRMLAEAGQLTAFATLFYEPWGVQSNDKFEAMIATTRKSDGTWAYDYTVFDQWVEFLASCGIDGNINCFSMVPWDMTFEYFDEATQRVQHLKTTTGTPEYSQLWTPFIQAFAAHLKSKGWFDRAVIAMDERGLEAMLDAYRIAQTAAPGIKMSLAGNYHAELADKIYDYCIAWGQTFTPQEMAMRNERGWITTTYTACPDAMPNLCSNNDAMEATYLPLCAKACGFNGFLRWAWMSWTDNPLVDTRFKLFTPGDTYVVYPGHRSSRRFERFKEGMQNVHKIAILRKEYQRKKQKERLDELEQVVGKFANQHPSLLEIRESIHQLEVFLNK